MSRKPISSNSAADREAARQAAFEGEVPELGRDFFERAQIRVGGRVLRPADGTFARRGRPPLGSAAKVQQSLRLSPEVLTYFKATGPGWQARIDEVLRRHVEGVGHLAGAQAVASLVEERSGYVAPASASAQDCIPAPPQPRRHKPRREWKKPSVRIFGAGDAEATGHPRDAAAVAS